MAGNKEIIIHDTHLLFLSPYQHHKGHVKFNVVIM